MFTNDNSNTILAACKIDKGDALVNSASHLLIRMGVRGRFVVATVSEGAAAK